MSYDARLIITNRTTELKTVRIHMIVPPQHVCNGLARTAEQSMSARTGQTLGERDIMKTPGIMKAKPLIGTGSPTVSPLRDTSYRLFLLFTHMLTDLILQK